MQGIVHIVFDENISFLAVFLKSPEAKYTKSNADILFPLSFSFLAECQDRKVFAFYVLFSLSQRVDLAYLQTGISGAFLGVLSFENLYFLRTAHSCCIFLGC